MPPGSGSLGLWPWLGRGGWGAEPAFLGLASGTRPPPACPPPCCVACSFPFLPPPPPLPAHLPRLWCELISSSPGPGCGCGQEGGDTLFCPAWLTPSQGSTHSPSVQGSPRGFVLGCPLPLPFQQVRGLGSSLSHLAPGLAQGLGGAEKVQLGVSWHSAAPLLRLAHELAHVAWVWLTTRPVPLRQLQTLLGLGFPGPSPRC